MDLRVDLGTSLGTAWRFRKRYLTITNLDVVAERGPAVALLGQAKTSRAPPASRQVMLRGDRPRSRNAAAEPTRALPGIPPSLRPLTILLGPATLKLSNALADYRDSRPEER